MQKEYGKLTADQFKDFIGKLPEVRRQRDEFGGLLAEVPKQKFDELMGSGFAWGEIYEYSFHEHLAIALVAFNQVKWVSDLAVADNPQQAILDFWPTELDDEDHHASFEPQVKF